MYLNGWCKKQLRFQSVAYVRPSNLGAVLLASSTENVKISKKGVQRPSYWV